MTPHTVLSPSRAAGLSKTAPAAGRLRPGRASTGRLLNADAQRFARDPGARLEATAEEARGLPVDEAAT